MSTLEPGSATDFWQQAPLLALVRDRIVTTNPDQRAEIAAGLMVALRDYYVHLPLKRSSMGIDPVKEFEILIDDVKLIPTEDEFFRRVIEIFRRLRDRHTSMRLPEPRSSAVAFLPFTLESYFDERRNRRLVLSKLMCEVGDPSFVPGVEITHWNGKSARRFVEALSWETEGANPFARIALALRVLTVRSLAYMLAPDEDWVALTYNALGGETRTVVIPWRVYFAPVGSATAAAATPTSGAASLLSGVDHSTAIVNGAWADLFARKTARADAIATEEVGLANVRAHAVSTPSGSYGYLRIFSFDAQDATAFVESIAKVLAELPQNGLILDVRSNPGGMIPGGEGLLQLFSKKWITTAPMSFRNTAATRRLGQSSMFLPWKRSLEMQLETGELFSQGFPITTAGSGPIGVYAGPVVLVIDSLSYSTTDFVSAGFQDNGIGAVVGIDPVTGAGGANVWSLSTIAQLDPDGDLHALPAGVDANLAVRRSVRVGERAGLPVEGVGVLVDQVYLPTKNDILGQNDDLIAFCASLLERS